jgi:hypothetical protein
VDHAITPPDTVIPASVERELTLIADAIALVRGGASTRVVVAGLRLADQILPRARMMASEAGVRVVPLWGADEHLTDIAVERRRP